MNIKQITFPADQYFQEEIGKKQIYLHHTASGPKAASVWNWWITDKARIATCVVIDASGEILQGFSSKFWAYHLGMKNSHFGVHGLPFKNLDKISIGIEICNWGQLVLKDGKFYNYVNKEVSADKVCTLDTPYKGYKYFEDYTDAQIESVKQLLTLWKERYNIPINYNEDIWGITKRALNGEAGVFTHNSVRPDKIDVYPNPKLIEMLKSL